MTHFWEGCSDIPSCSVKEFVASTSSSSDTTTTSSFTLTTTSTMSTTSSHLVAGVFFVGQDWKMRPEVRRGEGEGSSKRISTLRKKRKNPWRLTTTIYHCHNFFVVNHDESWLMAWHSEIKALPSCCLSGTQTQSITVTSSTTTGTWLGQNDIGLERFGSPFNSKLGESPAEGIGRGQLQCQSCFLVCFFTFWFAWIDGHLMVVDVIDFQLPSLTWGKAMDKFTLGFKKQLAIAAFVMSFLKYWDIILVGYVYMYVLIWWYIM